MRSCQHLVVPDLRDQPDGSRRQPGSGPQQPVAVRDPRPGEPQVLLEGRLFAELHLAPRHRGAFESDDGVRTVRKRGAGLDVDHRPRCQRRTPVPVRPDLPRHRHDDRTQVARADQVGGPHRPAADRGGGVDRQVQVGGEGLAERQPAGVHQADPERPQLRNQGQQVVAVLIDVAQSCSAGRGRTGKVADGRRLRRRRRLDDRLCDLGPLGALDAFGTREEWHADTIGQCVRQTPKASRTAPAAPAPRPGSGPS